MLCAIVAVARKLAGILHRMWVSEADFKVGFGSALRRRGSLVEEDSTQRVVD
jgi:hypothetical protein